MTVHLPTRQARSHCKVALALLALLSWQPFSLCRLEGLQPVLPTNSPPSPWLPRSPACSDLAGLALWHERQPTSSSCSLPEPPILLRPWAHLLEPPPTSCQHVRDVSLWPWWPFVLRLLQLWLCPSMALPTSAPISAECAPQTLQNTKTDRPLTSLAHFKVCPPKFIICFFYYMLFIICVLLYVCYYMFFYYMFFIIYFWLYVFLCFSLYVFHHMFFIICFFIICFLLYVFYYMFLLYILYYMFVIICFYYMFLLYVFYYNI